MRSPLLLASISVALAAVAACAASGDDPGPRPSEEESDGGLYGSDADVREAEVDVPPIEPPTCSDAGWCVTPFPDSDLMFKDIWPLPGRAFAIAQSKTLGVKVLEWEDASATWKYIDDDTQNDPGFGDHVGRMWAAGDNELYFTVSPGTIYHGTRKAPGDDWAWSRHQLEDHSPDQNPFHDHGHPTYRNLVFNDARQTYPALGVWGFGSDDVYAWYSNTIYHLTSSDGGPLEWTPEYIAADVDSADEHLYVLGAAGTDPNDVWFSIARDDDSLDSACAVVVRKTSAGYQRIVDGTVGWFRMCTSKPGFASVDGTNGWLTDLQAQAPDRFVGLKGGRDVVQISVQGDSYAVATEQVPYTLTLDRTPLFSLWSAPDSRLWLSGWAAVAQGDEVWDGGAFQLSTISLNGAPLDRPMYQVRGISSSNLWAVGVRYAFHKTTP